MPLCYYPLQGDNMPSLRIAHAYDRNRLHPPEVSGKIATAI